MRKRVVSKPYNTMKKKIKASSVGGAIGGLGYTASKAVKGYKYGKVAKFAGKTGIYDTIKSPGLAAMKSAGSALKTVAPAIAGGALAGYAIKKYLAKRKKKI